MACPKRNYPELEISCRRTDGRVNSMLMTNTWITGLLPRSTLLLFPSDTYAVRCKLLLTNGLLVLVERYPLTKLACMFVDGWWQGSAAFQAAENSAKGVVEEEPNSGTIAKTSHSVQVGIEQWRFLHVVFNHFLLSCLVENGNGRNSELVGGDKRQDLNDEPLETRIYRTYQTR